MLWPLVALVAVLAAWHRLGQWLAAQEQSRRLADRLEGLGRSSGMFAVDAKRQFDELASRMGRVELAVRER